MRVGPRGPSPRCASASGSSNCWAGSRSARRIPPRWNPAYVTFPVALQVECWFFFLYAALLLTPWQRTASERRWWLGFAVLCVASLLFAFAMISEVMAKNYLAAAQHQKARLPVFQAILLFLSLGQIPVALFTRKPDLLD